MAGNLERRENHPQPEGEVLYKNILAAFSGFTNSSIEKKNQPKEYKASVETVYKAFQGLSEEFPDKFPGLYFSDLCGAPYSRDLENKLFKIGAFGMLEHDNPRQRYLKITPKQAQAIQIVLEQSYGKKDLNNFIVIAKKFRELVKKFEEPDLISV